MQRRLLLQFIAWLRGGGWLRTKVTDAELVDDYLAMRRAEEARSQR